MFIFLGLKLKYTIWNINNHFDATYYIETDEKFIIGDLIKINTDFFLVKDNLGEGKKIEDNIEYIGNLFSTKTVLFQKFIADYWYSYYFKIFGLYIHDSKYILKYPLGKKIREKKLNAENLYISKYENFENYYDYLKMGDESIKTINTSYFDTFTPGKGQNLFVFPTLYEIDCFVSKITWKYDLVNVSGTNLSRYKSFLDIKNGKKKNIITTHAGIFQDWKNLKNIYIFYPYRWYYKNQQNPRYFTPDLLKQMKFFYNVENLYFVFSS